MDDYKRWQTEAALNHELETLQLHRDDDLIIYDPVLGMTQVLGKGGTMVYVDHSMRIVGQIAHLRTVGFAKEAIQIALERLADWSA